MVKSTTEIKRIAKIIEKEHKLNYYEILQRYMFERILERISLSNYKDNFILKGGLLLSAMFGIDNRTTKDMDTTITGIDVSKDKMIIILNNILNIDLKDGVKFDIIDITNIREDDEYGGNKYHIVGNLQALKINLEIDISTGDKITPKKLNYKYKLLFENRTILISSYNIETILSEKIETILRRGKFNSRMKDYYDIYYFLKFLKEDINIKQLKEAINNTFENRNSFNYLNDYKQIISEINNSDRMNKQWDVYKRKYKYATNIEFNEIIILVEEILNALNLEFTTV